MYSQAYAKMARVGLAHFWTRVTGLGNFILRALWRLREQRSLRQRKRGFARAVRAHRAALQGRERAEPEIAEVAASGQRSFYEAGSSTYLWRRKAPAVLPKTALRALYTLSVARLL